MHICKTTAVSKTVRSFFVLFDTTKNKTITHTALLVIHPPPIATHQEDARNGPRIRPSATTWAATVRTRRGSARQTCRTVTASLPLRFVPCVILFIVHIYIYVHDIYISPDSFSSVVFACTHTNIYIYCNIYILYHTGFLGSVTLLYCAQSSRLPRNP